MEKTQSPLISKMKKINRKEVKKMEEKERPVIETVEPNTDEWLEAWKDLGR